MVMEQRETIKRKQRRASTKGVECQAEGEERGGGIFNR